MFLKYCISFKVNVWEKGSYRKKKKYLVLIIFVVNNSVTSFFFFLSYSMLFFIIFKIFEIPLELFSNRNLVLTECVLVCGSTEHNIETSVFLLRDGFLELLLVQKNRGISIKQKVTLSSSAVMIMIKTQGGTNLWSQNWQ